MLQFKIDQSLCTFCSECIADCPTNIIEGGSQIPFISEENEVNCIQCQHCLAVCPEGALSILGKDPKESVPYSLMPNSIAFEALVRNRRTVRRFKDHPVSSDKINKMIQVAANAPTGKNSRKVTLILLDSKSIMDKAKEIIISKIEVLSTKVDLSKKERAYLTMAKLFRRGNDIIFRNAPHMVIAACPNNVSTPFADGMIALTYWELMAYTQNVGVIWAGFVSHLIDHFPELKNDLGIPENYLFVNALLFGESSIKYYRGVQRDDITIIRPMLI